MLEFLGKDTVVDIDRKFNVLQDCMKEIRDYMRRVENEKLADSDSIIAAFGPVASELTDIKVAAVRSTASGTA